MKRLLLVALVGGCTDLLAPMPGDPELFAPPLSYRGWYAKAEECSGRKGDFDRVRWYRYAGDVLPDGRGLNGTESGATWTRQHKIAIADGYMLDPGTVTHEALHDVIGTRGHPVEVFGKNDGGGYYGAPCSQFVNARPR